MSTPPVPQLKVRRVPWPQELGIDQWLFLDYGGGDLANLDARWAVERRYVGPDRFEWWGVVALFSATHERHLPIVAMEMELAQRAINQLRDADAVKK